MSLWCSYHDSSSVSFPLMCSCPSLHLSAATPPRTNFCCSFILQQEEARNHLMFWWCWWEMFSGAILRIYFHCWDLVQNRVQNKNWSWSGAMTSRSPPAIFLTQTHTDSRWVSNGHICELDKNNWICKLLQHRESWRRLRGTLCLARYISPDPPIHARPITSVSDVNLDQINN